MAALPIDIYSPDQLSELVLELQDLAAALRDEAARGDTNQVAISPDLAALLNANQIGSNDVNAIEAITKDVEATLLAAPTVHILLAASPNRVIKRQLVEWFRTEINPQTLLTFAARSDLGGGAIIQAGSHLYDMSFRRGIIDNKKRLTEIAGV
jgi:hypothetical protein